MSTGIRHSLYLSGVKDKDIIEYIKPKLQHYDFSPLIRGLIRDGISFRKAGPTEIPGTRTQSVTLGQQPDLSKVELKKKELSSSDLDDRLDSF